jgi:quinol monooxygenase YgiN
MPEVVVVGSFTAREGREAEAAEAWRALVAPTHAEEGCVLYALHQGADDPRRLAFIERWSSREALDAHLESSHVQAGLAQLEELFEGGEIVVYDALPAGEPVKGSLAEHAGG